LATTEWESITIGQNKKIQEVVAAASKASDLLNQNVAFAKTGLQAAQVFLQGILNPKIILLTAIADEIDKFVEDLKGTGFYILELTDTENYPIPEDADGNPIKLILGSAGVTFAATAAAAAGQTKEFGMWAKEFLYEPDIFNTGPTKFEYETDIGKSKPADKRISNANDDSFAEKDELTGLYKMTPSQIIATMVSAMEDPLDQNRPQFSSSAEAGAIVFVVGVSDLTKNLPNLYNVVWAFLNFFGGENGLLTKGGQNLGGMLAGIVGGDGWINNLDECEVKLTVKNVCGVRGDDDDQVKLGFCGIDYNYKNQFEVNDYIVGPYMKFGQRCKGYVTEVRSTKEDGDKYVTQELTIQGVTDSDAIAFRVLGSGAKIQKVAYKQTTSTWIDDNSGEVCTDGPHNDYHFFGEMSNDSTSDDFKYNNPKKAITKVKREAGSTLLEELPTSDVTEEHTFSISLTDNTVEAGKFTTLNTVIGDIFVAVDKTVGPPPNFKKPVKLEDLIGEFTTFFSAIKMLTNSLRDIAKGSSDALDKMIAFLDSKIKELEEINKSLQAILKLFTTGLGDAGVFTLTIPPAVGGTDYIKQELQGATGRPSDTLDFTFGFMMVGGGPSIKTLQTLLTAASA